MQVSKFSIPFVIPNAGNLSDVIDLFGDVQGPNTQNAVTVVGIRMPDAWTAANVTFQGSDDRATFYNIYDENGSEMVVVADEQRFISLPARWLIAPRFIKVRSGTNGTPVAQGAARAGFLIVRPVL